MEIGEQDLVLAQQAELGRLRLLDLDDHVGPGEDLVRSAGDGRARGLEIGVVDADGVGGIGLHDDGIAALDEFAYRAGRQAGALDTSILRLMHDRGTGAISVGDAELGWLTPKMVLRDDVNKESSACGQSSPKSWARPRIS